MLSDKQITETCVNIALNPVMASLKDIHVTAEHVKFAAVGALFALHEQGAVSKERLDDLKVEILACIDEINRNSKIRHVDVFENLKVGLND